MNKRAFSRAVAEMQGMTYQDAAWATNAVFDTLKVLMSTQDKVVVQGFGVFRAVERGPKTFRHPSTGEIRVRPGYKTVKFNPSNTLVDHLNQI